MTSIEKKLQHKIDFKTKPLGALGILEKIAIQVATIQNTLSPSLQKPTIIVFAGDHGVANDGLSAYPQEVTYQMVMNFLAGGAAINVFAKQHNITLKIVDAGVNHDFEPHPNLVDAKIAKGTQSFLREKAMTEAQLEACFQQGKEIVNAVANTGCNVIGFGEMGIANTSSAAMIMSYCCKIPIEKCVGRGTGINDLQLENKIAKLKMASEFHGTITDPIEILRTFGGFEITQIVGAMLTAFEKNMLILVDGFIASSAFLVAFRIKDEIMKNAVFCHQSQEQGHKQMLAFMKADSLLQLNMRLGEGTGCAVAFPIIESSINFLNEMASFESAGISNKE
ncbi:nicotinate-nucleotide-dimethylbenzimidazole phosphoribosyltransferase [Arcicella aurantiaca]|uniref:Nicotinate-nucleotide--dimethylbenzimidazole phosphoribosyltransferase n=1 Tax=Arcicella aurantiaca TaxID=591202 RepID=A0A316DKS1_9BACT|nr:nicotinate-nucleotide--dimethylbenzimidazole phosphoribosyltransferase [Arcicella aurantiaca]PWK17303.1 nicotinate-nucleotide-dimethylbenzimidazole phosphoribosyltransferase [Arcicella aurantiaca]